MKRMLPIALLFVAISVRAQGLDLGGIGQSIANIALNARGGSSVDLNKHVGGVLFVPFPAFHSADNTIEYGCLGLGAELSDGVYGTKLHGAPLVLPMFNPVAISGYIFHSQWAQQHLTFTNFQMEAGVGVKPLPAIGTRGKFIIGNQIEGVVTFHFGKSNG